MYPAVFCRIFLLILIRSSHLVSDIVLDPSIPAASSQQQSKSSLSIIYPILYVYVGHIQLESVLSECACACMGSCCSCSLSVRRNRIRYI